MECACSRTDPGVSSTYMRTNYAVSISLRLARPTVFEASPGCQIGTHWRSIYCSNCGNDYATIAPAQWAADEHCATEQVRDRLYQLHRQSSGQDYQWDHHWRQHWSRHSGVTWSRLAPSSGHAAMLPHMFSGLHKFPLIWSLPATEGPVKTDAWEPC